MPKILDFFGRPFSPIYSVIMKARSSLYERGLFHSHRSSAFVISVGNLTLGGTGKTPCVQMIGRYLQGKGRKVAIVSRGYGGKVHEKVNLVSLGQEPLLSASEAGDEPRLHAESLPGVVVATGVVRKLPCRHVAKELGCDTILLDDGFQHLAVQRDLNLVLFNSSILAGNSRVFPGGDLREPVSALLRAHAFLLTNTTNENRERAERFKDLLTQRFPDRPVFFSSHEAIGVKSLHRDKLLPFTQLPSPLHGFCGIAHPNRFHHSLSEKGIHLSGFSSFKDHQPYTVTRLKKLVDMATQSEAAGLITTEKDLVKLKEFTCDLPMYALALETRVDETFWDFLDARITQRTSTPI